MQVTNLTQPNPGVQVLATTEPAGSTVVQIAGETTAVVSEAVASNMFENPFNEIRKLFAQIADMFTFEHSDITDDHKDFVSELFEDIVDKLE